MCWGWVTAVELRAPSLIPGFFRRCAATSEKETITPAAHPVAFGICLSRTWSLLLKLGFRLELTFPVFHFFFCVELRSSF